MHSFQGPSGITYFHDGDFSGDIVITDVDTVTGNKYGDDRIEIPFKDMFALVMQHLANKKISQLEQMTPDEIAEELLR